MRDDPVVIGALGGSGTRVVARLARAAGIFMGSRLNSAEDSVPMMEFYSVWLRCYLEGNGGFDAARSIAVNQQFRSRLVEHLAGLDDPAARWGVKVPRSILMLKYWHQRFPRFRFVHVIRNGLDMAYSDDRWQLHAVGDLVLTDEQRRYDERLQTMAYWSNVNVAAANFGERELAPRYMRIRFEDLCAEPARVCQELGRFLNAPDPEGVAQSGIREVTPPPSLGRWQHQPAEEVAELKRVGSDVLERFDYPNA